MEGLVERGCVWLDDDDDDDVVAPVDFKCRIFAGMQLSCSSSCMLAGNPLWSHYLCGLMLGQPSHLKLHLKHPSSS